MTMEKKPILRPGEKVILDDRWDANPPYDLEVDKFDETSGRPDSERNGDSGDTK